MSFIIIIYTCTLYTYMLTLHVHTHKQTNVCTYICMYVCIHTQSGTVKAYVEVLSNIMHTHMRICTCENTHCIRIY